MKTLFQRLLHLLRWSRHGADLREEIETHRSLRQYALERDGLGSDDAAHASRRAIGNIPLAIEDSREVWAMRAQPTGIVRLVIRRLGALIVAGLALGLAGSWWAARFVAPLLFQVEARDPMTFSGTAAVLLAVGVLAAWVPARRPARLDPATVLREG
jgi:hypothetical protein